MPFLKYTVHWVHRSLHTLLRKSRRVPQYVLFTLSGAYPDLKEPPKSFWQRKLSPPEHSLQELEEQFSILAKEKRVQGIVLHLESLQMPLSRLQTLHALIQSLQEQGKEVHVWAKSYDLSLYFLATAGSAIYLQEGGWINSLGFQQDHTFMKKTLEWCGLEMDMVRISPYKSAADRFTRTSISQEVEEMTNWLMDSRYQQLIETMASALSLSSQEVHSLCIKSPYTAKEALEKGLIHGLISLEDLPEHLGSKTKPAVIATWKEARSSFRPSALPKPGSYIAVIRVQGNIVDGPSKERPGKPPLPIPLLFDQRTGDITLIQQARKVARDKRAKAVILYIDSGGGSATASEAMYQALQKVAREKPLIAFMGSVAASGGYYIATSAQHIVAQGGTITGSIGVLAGKAVMDGFYEKLLMNRQVFIRGQKPIFSSDHEPFSEEERKKVWNYIQSTYDLFLERVAKARKTTTESIDDIARGKVWTGTQAYEHDLVDALGGLKIARSKACELAKLPENTPLKECIPVKQYRGPVLPKPQENIVFYALENLSHIRQGEAMYASPALWFHNLP